MNKSILINLLIICSVFIFPVNNIFAVTADDVRKQIEDTNNQIEELDRQILKYQQQITQTSQEKNTLAKLIKELTLTRSKLVTEKEKTQKKITETNLVIKELDSGISDQEKSIQNSKQSLGKMLQDIHINDNYSIVERLLSQNSLAEASNEYNNILAINKKIKEHLVEVKIQKETLLISKDKKETEQEKLESFKQNLTLQQKAVELTRKEKDKVLAETKNKEENYKKLLAEQETRRKAFEKELQDYESQLVYILNPNSLPKEGSEVLSWPLENILITSLFGPRWGGTHNGVDFRASVGTPVKAMAMGSVVGVGDTDLSCKGASFGKWVLIKYDNGLASTYGHLSAISAKQGQRVKTGDIIALSGNTGYSTGPHLHISVYAADGVSIETFPSKSCPSKTLTQPVSASNARFDPLLYLPKITASMVKK